MSQMKRREFLVKSIAGAGGLVFAGGLKATENAVPRYHEPYKYTELGQTRIKLTRVGIGTGMRGGNRQSNHTRMGQERFTQLILGAYEHGIRCFDAVDLYGTHPFLANTLKKIPRKDYVVTSKIWWRRGGLPESERPNADVVAQRFPQELKTEEIDDFAARVRRAPIAKVSI